ncbi:MAG TPA: hypothetical protein VEI02_13450, partial [Planctomycetota bacterium]|nr:hypothetical protein [Planctomycetota bacterium]
GAACVALALAVTHVFRLPDVARDAGSGAVVDGFRASTSTTRKLLEPFFGPPLYGGSVGGLRTFVAGSAFLAVAVGAVLAWRARQGHRARFALYLAVLLPSAWVSIFCAGGATPDRFKAKDRRGVFVDWHLHGGDPVDGRHTEERAMKRQEARGVDWAITTCHDFRPARAAAIAHGALGTEWSGGDHPRTPAPHVLVLGTSHAVDAAIAEKDALSAVRAAKAHGALVLVAHHWRSAKHVPNLPTPEAFVDAGADGFEVGNRHADAPAAEAEEVSAVARLDALCRERGLLRVSFSDDHGVPAGSPCVTWIEGVTEDDLKREGGVAILSRLRRDADPAVRIDPANVIPLLFDRVAPADRRSPFVAVFLWPLDYLRTLGLAQRASWFLWLAAFWFASRRFAVQERA